MGGLLDRVGVPVRGRDVAERGVALGRGDLLVGAAVLGVDGLVDPGVGAVLAVGVEQVDLAVAAVGGAQPERCGGESLLEGDLGADLGPEVVGQGVLADAVDVAGGVAAAAGALLLGLDAQGAVVDGGVAGQDLVGVGGGVGVVTDVPAAGVEGVEVLDQGRLPHRGSRGGKQLWNRHRTGDPGGARRHRHGRHTPQMDRGDPSGSAAAQASSPHLDRSRGGRGRGAHGEAHRSPRCVRSSRRDRAARHDAAPGRLTKSKLDWGGPPRSVHEHRARVRRASHT